MRSRGLKIMQIPRLVSFGKGLQCNGTSFTTSCLSPSLAVQEESSSPGFNYMRKFLKILYHSGLI